jgi:hypothetical protein
MDANPDNPDNGEDNDNDDDVDDLDGDPTKDSNMDTNRGPHHTPSNYKSDSTAGLKSVDDR